MSILFFLIWHKCYTLLCCWDFIRCTIVTSIPKDALFSLPLLLKILVSSPAKPTHDVDFQYANTVLSYVYDEPTTTNIDTFFWNDTYIKTGPSEKLETRKKKT